MAQQTTDIAVYQAHGETGMITLSIKDIQNFICPDSTPEEAMTFLKVCQYQGLNPFIGDAYLVIYTGQSGRNVSIILGKDTFTKRAHRNPAFEGFQAGIVVETKGTLVEREGTLYGTGEKLVGGWATVYRSDKRIAFKQVCRLAEFDTKRRNWMSMPGTMIRKVALVQALREAFPEDLGALYDSAEMGMSISDEGKAEYDGPVIEAHTTVPDSVPEVDANPNSGVPLSETRSPETGQNANARVSEAQLATFFALVKELGVPGQEIQRAIKEEPDLQGIPVMNTRADSFQTRQPWQTNQLEAIEDWMKRTYSTEATKEEAENVNQPTSEPVSDSDGPANEASGTATPGDSDANAIPESQVASAEDASDGDTESTFPSKLPEPFDSDSNPDQSPEPNDDQLPF